MNQLLFVKKFQQIANIMREIQELMETQEKSKLDRDFAETFILIASTIAKVADTL